VDGKAVPVVVAVMGVSGGKITVGKLDGQFAGREPPGPDEPPITVAIDRQVDEIIGCITGVLLSSAEAPNRVRSNLEGIS
jgi:hypothetical protein